MYSAGSAYKGWKHSVASRFSFVDAAVSSPAGRIARTGAHLAAHRDITSRIAEAVCKRNLQPTGFKRVVCDGIRTRAPESGRTPRSRYNRLFAEAGVEFRSQFVSHANGATNHKENRTCARQTDVRHSG